jgi:hypothetical protein
MTKLMEKADAYMAVPYEQRSGFLPTVDDDEA